MEIKRIHNVIIGNTTTLILFGVEHCVFLIYLSV